GCFGRVPIVYWPPSGRLTGLYNQCTLYYKVLCIWKAEVVKRRISYASALDPAGDESGALPRSRHSARADPAALCAPAQSFLSEGSARQFRQARPHAVAGANEHRRCDSARVAGRLLGREFASGAAALAAVTASCGHHRPSHLREARLRAGSLV